MHEPLTPSLEGFAILKDPGAGSFLPLPVSLPDPPEAVDLACRDSGLVLGPPVQDAARTPVISMGTDCTFADETFAATGTGLMEARLVVWDGRDLWEIEPIHRTDDRLLACLPADLRLSTLLIWPVAKGIAGSAFRINASTIWWSRLEPMPDGSFSLRLFGRNLALGDTRPRVWCRGEGYTGWLQVSKADAWQLAANLPAGLPDGEYQLQAHNGTGGEWGWSEPIVVQVTNPAPVSRVVLDPARWGALSDGATDSAEALEECFAEAVRVGGTVRLAAGTYCLGRTIRISGGGSAAEIRGVGTGEHRWTRDTDTHTLSGSHTAMTVMPGAEPLPALIRVESADVTLADVTFINGVDGAGQSCVVVAAPRASVVGCRFIAADAMPKVAPELRQPHSVESGALHLASAGSSGIVVEDCDFHHLGAGVFVGWRDSPGQATATNDVRISRCQFTGYFPGLYCKGDGVEILYSGFRCIGVVNIAGSRLIIENCGMQGAARTRGRTINRMFLSLNSANRHQFVAGNRGRDVGNHVSLGPGLEENMGEQIMFHFRYPDGGIFRCTEADDASVTLDLADPSLRGDVTSKNFDGNTLFIAVTSPLGSRVPADVGMNNHWMVLVSDGRGIGQFRIVVGIERFDGAVRLILDRPWRLPPDSGSRIVLQACYHQNHVVGNSIDTGGVDAKNKSHGTLFWFNSIENVVADNEFRNLSGGTIWNHGYRNPTAWNLTLRNRFAHIHGNSGDTSASPACWVNHYRVFHRWPEPAERVAYSIGEICRHNSGEDVHTAVYLHARFEDWAGEGEQFVDHPRGGVILGVIEHCDFRDAQHGICLSSPANGVLVRKNQVETTNFLSPAVFDETTGESLPADFWLRLGAHLPESTLH